MTAERRGGQMGLIFSIIIGLLFFSILFWVGGGGVVDADQPVPVVLEAPAED